jgi:hypothetical protein
MTGFQQGHAFRIEWIMTMSPGEWFHIPTHTWHRVDWTTRDEPTVWLEVLYEADMPSRSC